jgi:hypothetical protein
MEKRKVLIVALFLITIITGIAVAASIGGVDYWWDNGDTRFMNNNSYGVICYIKVRSTGQNIGRVQIKPNSSYWLAGEVIITRVTVWYR